MRLTHLSLFSGIGGIDLAAEWAGFETVGFVEKDAYCQKVLRKHWPDVPIMEDIHNVTGSEYSVTLVTGGFPCQPFSVAGKRRGKEDDRWLWPEMLRIIAAVRPRWVVAENVAGLIHMGLDDCISDLENSGYTVEPYLIPACAVNAPHRRDRIFIVAHCDRSGFEERRGGKPIRPAHNSTECSSETVAHSDSIVRRQGRDNPAGKQSRHGERLSGIRPVDDWWAVEPDVGRVAYGVPSRVDRLRALGNAVVPQQIYPILKTIAEIENGQS